MLNYLICDLHCLQNDTPYLGALVGRVANRIGGAKFTLDGKQYKVVANDGNNTLHGNNYLKLHLNALPLVLLYDESQFCFTSFDHN